MSTKYCPECYSKIVVGNHTILSICPNCKKCIKPIAITSTEESLEDIEPFLTNEELMKINQRLFKLNAEIDQKEMESNQ
jgi:hypothetical protein